MWASGLPHETGSASVDNSGSSVENAFGRDGGGGLSLGTARAFCCGFAHALQYMNYHMVAAPRRKVLASHTGW